MNLQRQAVPRIARKFQRTQQIVATHPNKRRPEILPEHHKKIYNVANIFDAENCRYIIQESEKYAQTHRWKTRRHRNYPTTDNDIKNIPSINSMVVNTVKEKLFPEFSRHYDVSVNIIEIFIAKYTLDGQNSLELHQDGSDFSFVIALNKEFEGGGTFFKDLDQTFQPDAGNAIIFSGRQFHSGVKITEGNRYILTGFLRRDVFSGFK